MAGLTASEKSHWRDRLNARIDKMIEFGKTNHAARFHRLALEAHAQALVSLGLNHPRAELEDIRVEEAALAGRKKKLHDTVWLAVAPAEIKELWGKIEQWLNEDVTPLQRAALTIELSEEA